MYKKELSCKDCFTSPTLISDGGGQWTYRVSKQRGPKETAKIKKITEIKILTHSITQNDDALFGR